jgi:hypothetical protein
MLSVIGDILVDNEVSLVTSSISRIYRLNLSHRGRIYLCAFTWVSVLAL